MKPKTKKAIDMALTDYHGNMIDALTTNAVNAHIAGDMKAFVDLKIPIAKNLVQAEAMVYGQEYRALLRAEGASIIKGKKIPWLAEQATGTRDEVYSIIETGLKEGKPIASIGGKHAVPGTIAHDLKETLIYDADYKYVRAARSEHARIQNQGALTRFEKNNIVEVEVVDGMDFDEACAMANGQIWTLEYARRNETEHPNCTRTFGPVIPKDWMPPEEELVVEPKPRFKAKPKAKPIPPVSVLKKSPTHTSSVESLIGDIELVDEAAEQRAFWKVLEKKGWSADSLFVQGNIGFDDVLHLDKYNRITAMSRTEIRAGILHIDSLEVNASMRRSGKGLMVMRDIIEDGLAKNAARVELTSMTPHSDKFYRALGMTQKKHSFFGDASWMKAFIKEME